MLQLLNDLLWGKVLIFVLIPVGIWFTIASRFVQFRFFTRMFAILGSGFQHHADKPSSFQALALSVAGRVGAGNIAGVAVAITLGGSGAIFWMWIVGLVGMATSFFECSIAQLFKRLEPSGNFRGGPAFYIQHGLKKQLGGAANWLAALYSILLLVTFGVAFNILQSYAVSTSVAGAFNVDPLITGLVLALAIGIVIYGGIGRITKVVEIVVPVMAVSYIALALFVIATRAGDLPAVLSTIVTSAFGLNEAIAGGHWRRHYAGRAARAIFQRGRAWIGAKCRRRRLCAAPGQSGYGAGIVGIYRHHFDLYLHGVDYSSFRR